MIWLLVSLAILAADQIVKYLVSVNIGVGETAFSVLNIFDVTYVQNQGAAFSVAVCRCIGKWNRQNIPRLCRGLYQSDFYKFSCV